MYLKEILILTCIAACTFACNNENEPSIENLETTSSLKYAEKVPSSAHVNAIPFTLESAGIHDDHLYANVSYVGGEKKHDFRVNWDGQIKESGENKMIQLNIYHLTDDDNGTRQIKDSLSLSLDKLNIPDDIKETENLIYDIVNTSDQTNHFLVKTNIPTPPIEEYTLLYELVVTDAGCNQVGEWENYWLKSTGDSTIIHFIPANLDESIQYSPKLNDLLKVRFQFTSPNDLSGANDCEFIQQNPVEAIKIKEIEVIN